MKTPDQLKDVAKRNDGSATPTAGRSAPQDIVGTKDKPGSKTKAAGNPGGGNGQRTGNGHGVARPGADDEATAATASAPAMATA